MPSIIDSLLNPGIHSVFVTDVNGCVSSDTVFIFEPEQLLEPILSCWQVANFDTLSCSWSITGDQPVIPTISCWQVANFNSDICTWEISGTQITSTIILSANDLDIVVEGGEQPYTFLWNTNETTQQINLVSAGVYWSIVTDVNGCVADTSFYEVDEIHSNIFDYSISDIKIYPNPSKDVFSIGFSSLKQQKLTYRVINAVGSELFFKELDEFMGVHNIQIDLAIYDKGVYFLELEGSNGVINKKLILQ